MALFIVVSKLPAAAMAIYPFILIKRKEHKNDRALVNHEKIHLQQQIELLIVPFYLIYLLHYLVNLLRFKSHHQAYLNIIFEKEAYANEGNLHYNKIRKTFAAFRHLKA